MGTNDMNHMQHLESVALSDCAVLESKEATYQGSWKRAGGRSAWFMARRNLDRLITMMKPPEEPPGFSIEQPVRDNPDFLAHLRKSYIAEDLFKMIAANPKGEDGTVLACMRDARRYFTLVEAEMIAEGVVEPESKTYDGDAYPQDVYTMIANDTGILRDEVKRRIHDLFYRGDASVFSTENSALVRDDIKIESTVPQNGGAVITPAPTVDPGPAVADAFTMGGGWNGQFGKITEKDVVFEGARELDPGFDKVLMDDGLVYENGQKPRPPTIEELAALGREEPCVAAGPSPEDGAQHASLVPWEIGSTYRNTLIARAGNTIIDAFYAQRTSEKWRLECVVISDTIPREIKDCYDYTKVDGRIRWVLKRGQVPADLDEDYPRLQIEMNPFEFETSAEEFQFMYSPVGEKVILRHGYMNWARLA